MCIYIKKEYPLPWDDLYLVYDLDLLQVKPSCTEVQVAKLAFSKIQPWPNDLDTGNWPRYGQDVCKTTLKWSVYANCLKWQADTRKILPTRTDGTLHALKL